MSPGASKERILQWRASIYEQNVRAIPCPRRRCLGQGFLGRNGNKESLLQRIEPWIHMELHAVLGDPNPAILVHLMTSLFILSLEETQENNYLECLHPFLLERTITFWHELRLLGTPNEEIWPEVSKLKDFHEYPQWKPKQIYTSFPTLDQDGLDLLSKMLEYEPSKRISAKKAMEHPYFADLDKTYI